MGYKSELQASLGYLTEKAKDRLIQELCHVEVQDEWIAAYKRRLKRGEKDAVRLYPELLRMIGPENSISMLIVNRYGCASEDELERLVGQYREAAALSDEQRFEKCLQFAEVYLKKHPERMIEATKRIENSSRRIALAEVVP